MRSPFLLVGALFVATSVAAAQRPAPATLVVRHAAIWTGDATLPRAQAMAIVGDSIVAIGRDQAIAPYIGRRTKVVDARGRTVLPGFADSHVHFLMGALALVRVSLGDATDMASLRGILRRWQQQHPGTDWVVGRGWTYGMIGGDGMPTARDLDDLFPDRPVMLSAYDGHTSWVNSKALALAGITKDTPNPPNGVIVRDASGAPTGALKERASALVSSLIPAVTDAERRRAMLAGMQHASALGVTRVQSAHGDIEVLPLLDSLRREGLLTVRFDVGVFVDPPALTPTFLGTLDSLRQRYQGAWLSAGLVKLMIDGVVESHTAAMLAPYTTDTTTRGTLFWPVPAFTKAVTDLDALGLRVMTHAIGDRGVRTVLDAYAAARRTNGPRDRIQRIEHIETIDPSDIPRFGREGVIASMQPLHAYPEGNGEGVWTQAIGPARAGRAWVWKQISDSGGRIAFGSDWPVVSLNPWPGVQVAVTRQTTAGKPPLGFVPSERLPVAAAITAYTMGPAVAGGRQAREGSLAKGKLADFIIAGRDPFRATPAQLAAMAVDMTVVGGRVVYQRR